MIGTPNDGSPIAELTQWWPVPFRAFMCWPAIDDLTQDSTASKAPINPHTHYYTIGGDWDPFTGFTNCSSYFYYALTWGSNMVGKDDGLVPLESAVTPEEQPFVNIGLSNNCHTDLLGTE